MNENNLAGSGAAVEVTLSTRETTPVVAEMNSAEEVETPESLKGIENEAPGFFSKLKNAGGKVVDFFSHEEVRKQVAESTVSMVASVAGMKSFYDVPNYLHQRFMVRGIDLGPFGQGKGMTGSVERLIGANREMRGDFGEDPALESSESKSDEVEGESHSVRDAIRDLNERLALTKEGDRKGSEQRKMIAKLLMENRTRERMNAEERSERMTTILDDYTTTKVTGMQAARETLNTALVASGAMSLRGISYSMLDGVERYQRLSKEAGVDGENPEIFKDVILGGINETLEEATLRNSADKGSLRAGLDSVKAWGKILRAVGMGSTLSMRPEAMGNDMEKVLDAFSGKTSFGDVAENFQGNIDRTIDGYKRVADAINPFHATDANAADVLVSGRSGTPGSIIETTTSPAEESRTDGDGRIVGFERHSGAMRVGVSVSEVAPDSGSEYGVKVDMLKSAIPDGESKSIGGLTFGRDGEKIYLVDAKRGEVKLVTQENIAGILAAQSYNSGEVSGSKGGPSLAERAAAAQADLGKGASAVETLQKPGVDFSEKMNLLKETIEDGETVHMNGLNMMRKGNDFFLVSNGKSVRIMEGNLKDILRIRDNGRMDFLNKARKMPGYGL
ncbi:MAG: hypothetical protein KBD19_03335 [Candidatus Moranbacteria bacterium]|nr:hypothetical protein [Candidatus Moranbacteria bacterium]